jgi:hypothetical protein
MKKLAVALGAALVIAGVAAIHLGQQLHAQREQNASAMTRVTALESAHPAGAMAVPAINDGTRTAAPVTAVAQPGPAAAAPGARNQSPGRGADPLRALAEQLQNSPEGREFQRVMMRQTLEDEFPNLAKDLNLSPDKAGKLLDLLAKQRLDLAAEGLGQMRGGTQDRAARAEMARKREEQARAFQAELKSLLGDSYSKWNDYESAAADSRRQEYTRMGTQRLRDAITAGGPPLTDAQFQYLNSAITAEQKRIDQETRSVQQQMQRLPETNRRLVEVAAAHLNPQQLDRYRRYLQQQQEMMSAIDAMGAFDDE